MTRFVPLLLLLLAALPGALGAQSCLGAPQQARGTLSGVVDFPSGATSYSAAASVRAGRALYLAASGGITAYDMRGLRDSRHLGTAVAYQVSAPRGALNLCPRFGVDYTAFPFNDLFHIAAGVGLGRTVSLGRGGALTLTPFAAPRVVRTQNWEQGFPVSTGTTDLRITAGATLSVRRLLVGASRSSILVGEPIGASLAPFYGLQVGFAF